MKFTKRVNDISPFFVMEILEKAQSMEARGEDIIHMEVGEPDFPTPHFIKKAAVRAIVENHTAYTHSLGIPDLRSRIARYYFETHGLNIPEERVIITNGTSGAFLLLFGTLLQQGSALAVSDPGYPCYKNIALFVDADVLQIPVSEDSHFEITTEHLYRAEKMPDALVLANPSNPTGVIYSDEGLLSLCNHLSKHNSFFIIDEIYSGLSYSKKPGTALAISDDIIVIDGFSKTFAMTGFRIGWMVVPEPLVRPLQKCAQNLFISPPSISQYAALSAFDNPEETNSMRKTYEERRNFLVPRLKDIGFSIPVCPDGAFYIYAGIKKWNIDSMDFVNRALAEAHVAITPGYDFGKFQANTHVRFSYTENLDRLRAGCERLEHWLTTL